ncbi:MAG: DUF998 domain-containing protein [Thermoplasmata archaeon]|nr:DUF998 domain-containing protein [Thermoplasmata archaeon]
MRTSISVSNYIKIGAVSGIFASISFSILWVFAVIVNGNWTLGEDTLSELGGNVPSRWIFNIAVILAGIGSIRFSFGLARFMAPSLYGRIGGYIMAVAGVGLISVGFFPIDTGDPHTIATIFFFGSAGISALVLVFPFIKKSGVLSVPTIVLLAAIIISLISIGLTPIPFAEAVAVSALLVWLLITSFWMLSDMRRLSVNPR